MEYRKFGEKYYIRMDKGDEIIAEVLKVCKFEDIRSCTFCGIGGCSRAEIQTFIPETGTFETRRLDGMLELVSMSGNVVTDEQGEPFHHTHAVLAYKDGDKHNIAAGHMKAIYVSYTAEILLLPVTGGEIKRKFDPETGTGFWHFV